MPIQHRRRPQRNFLGTKKRAPRAGRHSIAPHNPSPTAPNVTNVKDYDAKYPPDASGTELDETARVWRIYYDEAIEVDDETIQEYNESIDILLVFVSIVLDQSAPTC